MAAHINAFTCMQNGLFHLHFSDPSVAKIRGVRLILIITMFYRMSVLNAKMLCSAASDLGLHSLPVSLLWDARLK